MEMKAEVGYPGSQGLFKLLVRSHLLVASIGGGALVIAFAAILMLQRGMENIVEKLGPLERTSVQLMSGVERSLAALRGWVSLNDPRFVEQWEDAWKNDIRQALYRLEGLRDSFAGEERERLEQLKPWLDDLEESQWWVRSVAQTPGNQPAAVVYENHLGPVAEVVGRIFDDLRRLVHQPGSRHPLELMDFMISLQREFSRVRLLVDRFVAHGSVFRENEYRHLINQLQSRLRTAEDRFSGSIVTRIKLLEQELEAFRTLADEAIGLRKSSRWNRAQHLMETETVPIAREVTRIVHTLSGNATRRMTGQIRQSGQFTTFATRAILALIIAVMLAAIMVARQRSRNLSQPLAKLAEAARTFAEGRLDHEVKASGSLEMELLGDTFNDMRRRLVKSRESLRNANERLEERVQARTRDLLDTNRRLQESEERFRSEKEFTESLIQTAQAIILVLEPDGRIVRFNPFMEQLTGYTLNEVAGEDWFTTVLPGEEQDRIRKLSREAIFDIDTSGTINPILTKDGTRLDIQWATKALTNKKGRRVGVISVGLDITERKQAEEKIKTSLKEKEVLLREVHHRVKNNMQVITSLLNLQARRTRNKEAVAVLQESQQRVRAMAMAHERLYRSRDLAHLKLSDYVSSLVNGVQQLFSTAASRVTVQTQVTDLPVSMDQAIPLGLIINELVTNALKYAFPKGRSGTLTVSMEPVGEDEIELMVADDGVGIPEDLDWQHTNTMGLMLVTELCRQLHGVASLDRSNGARWQIVFER